MHSLAFCALLLAAVPPASRVPRTGAEIHRLPNGLRVVFIRYDAPGLVAYDTLMRVGSRNEAEPGRSGYAHFFEHMMFRGTPAHPSEDYQRTTSALGLNTNAFTSEDATVYWLYGPAKALPTIIAYEADRFQHLTYDEPAFKTEAGAILGEYAKSASDPEQLMEEKLLETAYARHTYRHTVIGYLADVKAMPGGYAYSREFFRRYYTPDNATIFVVGDFDHAAALAQIAKAYGSWRGALDPVPIPADPAQTVARRASMAWPSPTLPRAWLAWHSPGAADLRATAVQLVLEQYLFGETSPLVQDLVRDRQIADAVESAWRPHRDPYVFGVLLRMKSEADLRTGERAVLDEISRLQKGRVDRDRVAAVRSNVRNARAMSLDRANSVAVRAAVTTALTGDIQFDQRLQGAVGRVTADDLVAFARHWLTARNSTTVTLATGPGQGGGGG